ncbi:uridine diphosphate-N-acetylglucosamine-binding protein YvcK [uncultured Cetobacterium sp.]|uniref:gluconeogenesis factor YvcK family protein n=1 Tax=uncultured Cetobacterium sp. TaxID=527638 RepID=UPI00260F79B2|nr:uridine diphosphate-N-acetylglucosamine-binding protein YvcK [uncultured Cetobacterium sp.]
MRYPKVVVIGGGSGLSVVLRGLKHFPIEITAIVSVADSGGSSGILKKEFNIPAPGDLRNVMIALSNVEPLIEEVFQFRFGKTSSIGAHPLGNLLITAMTEITGDVQIAIKKLRKLFNIKGKILPATLEKIELIAEKESGGFIFGESDIPVPGEKIKRVFYDGEVNSPAENIKAIKEADLIVFSIGSLYTSIIPNLLLENMQKALKESRAEKIYICNAVGQVGETENYNVSDHIISINKHVGYDMIDKVIVNSVRIDKDILDRYKEEGSTLVKIDKENLDKMRVEVIEENLIKIDNQKRIRHLSHKLGAAIYSQIDNLENFYDE